jgi:protease-4
MTPHPMPGPMPGPMYNPMPPMQMMPPMMPFPYPPPPRRGGAGRAIFITLLVLLLLGSGLLNLVLLGASLTGGGTSGITQHTVQSGSPGEKIAVIPLRGVIDTNVSMQFNRFLQTAEADKAVKALVIEIDTPGGTVTASDEIYNRIRKFKSKRSVPVVVSMGSLATSGGYYAACGADYVFAQPTTFTGNIGVLMPRYNFSKLMDKYCVAETTIVSSGAKIKNPGSSFSPEKPEEKKYMQELADSAFAQFKEVVTTGRSSKLNGNIEDIANGKVYTAKNAKDLGLIDDVGYLDDAQKYAASQAGLASPTVVRYQDPPSLMQILLASKSNVPGALASQGGGAPGVNVTIDPSLIHELTTPRPLYLWRGQDTPDRSAPARTTAMARPNGRLNRFFLLGAILLATALAARPARAASPKEVNEAVARAVKYLYDVQQDSNWEMVGAPAGDGKADVRGKQWGGLTAIATYALLAAGENPQDERLAKAINWLLDNDQIQGTYAVGLRAQVWQFLPEKHPQRTKIKAAIKRDRDILAAGMHQKGDTTGFYGYYPGDEGYDRSNSQYGLLGMWAVEQAGAEVPRKYWEVQNDAWIKAQHQDGGWNYNGDGDSKATMSAAGIATLFITQDYLLDVRRDCQGNTFNQNIEMGMAYMDRHVNVLLGGNFYGMYGVERIGVAGGRKYFGSVDWYAAGADFLVKNQGGDGAWGGEDDNGNARKIPNTCFSLLFLTRGRAPVLMNKLDYSNPAKEGKETGWNQRPRDMANFCRWMTRNLDGRFTNWQIVNLRARPEELHDAPILYMAGSEAFNMPKEDAEKLKLFVEQGGLILGNADCGNAKFVRSFTALGAQLFNNEFRELELTHPLLSGQQFNASKWKQRPRVLALGNGVREQMILVPRDDLSKAFQTRSDRTKEELFQLSANIFLYLVRERPMGYKGETYVVRDNPEAKADREIKLARLEYPGNWNPEPGGWRRLATVM